MANGHIKMTKKLKNVNMKAFLILKIILKTKQNLKIVIPHKATRAWLIQASFVKVINYF